MKNFFKKGVATISRNNNKKSEKIDEEKLSERAYHVLKTLDFQEKFVIMDAHIFLREAERVFNGGFTDNLMQHECLRKKLQPLRKNHNMKDHIKNLLLKVNIAEKEL